LILGTGSRALSRQEAYARTSDAARALLRLQPRRVAVKYCSTFDSTPEGNIGASIDAAMDVLGVQQTVALPALPALGRTTYMGYHFVGDKLLSDSGMRHHPLNPMTNPHLPSHLQSQTQRRVGLLQRVGNESASEKKARLEVLFRQGVEIAMLDCVDDIELRTIGEVIQDWPLITGSSSWAMVLPQIWKETGAWSPVPATNNPFSRVDHGKGVMIVSGSCSPATRDQNQWAADHGYVVTPLDPLLLARGESVPEEIIAASVALLADGEVCVWSTTEGTGRSAVDAWATAQGISAIEAGARIAENLSRAVCRVFERQRPEGLVVAGGETSSTLMRVLQLGGLQIGANVEPGVPVCVALSRPELGVVLKSGNFGSEDFFARAVEAIRALPRSSKRPEKA
jgi:uncharacterized protein YgbK (DUF1537 family)